MAESAGSERLQQHAVVFPLVSSCDTQHWGKATEMSDGNARSEVELHLQRETLLDLRHVVNDELVVQQRRAVHRQLLAFAHGHCDGRVARQRDGAVGVGGGRPLAPGRVALLRLAARGRGGLGLQPLILIAECDLAQHEHASRHRAACEAVIGALGAHVSKVDALAEHVAGGGGFGRGDAQPRGEDARPVGEARTVPQQLPVANVSEALRLPLADHLKGLLQLEGVARVGGAMRVGDVRTQHPMQLRVLLDGLQVGVQLRVLGVDGVHVKSCGVDDA
mmetsp:Transcript_41813/g.97913  ORF Transcript_41813/g.97913 Transcript_41813/m.97913 type:complete len:277 (+) Transcript_41813:417-1247(+)